MKLPKYPKRKILYHLERDGSPRHNIPIVFDNTDHFYFLCPDCQELAEICLIELTEYNGYPEIYFTISCSNCGVIGSRKVWAGIFYERTKRSLGL